MGEIVELFITFAKIGVVTFGGGYAMLPIIQREVVDKKGWITEEELIDYYAIGQCTPGVIAVNVATFVGNKKKGIIGGIAATLGVVFPSLVIISIIACLLSNFADYTIVKNAFVGIRASVCVLVFNVVLNLWKKTILNESSFIIFILVLLAALFTNLSPIVFVVFSAVIGIILQNIKIRGNEE